MTLQFELFVLEASELHNLGAGRIPVFGLFDANANQRQFRIIESLRKPGL